MKIQEKYSTPCNVVGGSSKFSILSMAILFNKQRYKFKKFNEYNLLSLCQKKCLGIWKHIIAARIKTDLEWLGYSNYHKRYLFYNIIKVTFLRSLFVFICFDFQIRSIYLHLYLSIYLSFNVSISIYISTYLSVYIYIYTYIYTLYYC